MKYGFIVNNTIDTVSFNPPRERIPAVPAVLNEDGSVKIPAIEEHWGNLKDGWVEIPDEAFAGFIKQGSAWVAPETPPKPIDEILVGYKYAFDQHLDRVAQAKQYDNRLTITTYCTSNVPDWKAEAEQFIEWRDSAMLKMFEILGQVQSGTLEQPSIEEFIELLPETPWAI